MNKELFVYKLIIALIAISTIIKFISYKKTNVDNIKRIGRVDKRYLNNVDKYNLDTHTTNNNNNYIENTIKDFDSILNKVNNNEKVVFNGNAYYSHKIVIELLEEYSSEEGENHGKITSSTIIINSLIILFLTLFAGLMSGLTVGYLSIDELVLELKIKGGTDEEKETAKKIQEILSSKHRLLVTLLISNAAAMEALPLFINKLVPEWAAILISTTLVLFIGEVIPQAICTGPEQLNIAAKVAPITKLLLVLLTPLNVPLGKMLDVLLGVHSRNRFMNTDLRSLIELHTYTSLKKLNLLHGEHTETANNSNNNNLNTDSNSSKNDSKKNINYNRTNNTNNTNNNNNNNNNYDTSINSYNKNNKLLNNNTSNKSQKVKSNYNKFNDLHEIGSINESNYGSGSFNKTPVDNALSNTNLDGYNNSTTFNNNKNIEINDNPSSIMTTSHELLNGDFGLNEEQANLMISAIEMKEKRTIEVMIPVVKTFMISYDDPIDNVRLSVILERGFSRIPVYAGTNSEDIIGLVRIKQLIGINLQEKKSMREHGIQLKKPLVIYPKLNLLDLLREFKKGKSHMAFITENVKEMQNKLGFSNNNTRNKNKGIDILNENTEPKLLGIVTLEDVIEKMINIEIYDEDDYESLNKKNKYSNSLKNKLIASNVSKEIIRENTIKLNSIISESLKKKNFLNYYSSDKSPVNNTYKQSLI